MLIMSKLYTPAERDFIFDNYRYLTTKQIATHLNRTPLAIQQWKEKQGLYVQQGTETEGVFNTIGIMQSLINLCETTTNPIIKHAAKMKLMDLSEIPKKNIWGIDTVIRYASRAKPTNL